MLLVSYLSGGCLATITACLLQRHPTRRRIWIPIGFGVLLVAAIAALRSWDVRFIGGLLGAGFLFVAAGSRTPRADAAWMLACVVFFALIIDNDFWTYPIRIFLAVCCAIVFATSIGFFRRYIGECLLEWPIRVMYRLRAIGPGMEKLPRTGPVLVIANHSTYLDPC